MVPLESAGLPVAAEELEKARCFAKGPLPARPREPHATIMFGLRRELLEGPAVEPEGILAGLDAVTGDDVQRVADDILGKDLRLALIGPFVVLDAANTREFISDRIGCGTYSYAWSGLNLAMLCPKR